MSASYRLEAVASSASADFAEAYAALAAEFAPRGELERREVIARWLDEPAPAGAKLRRSYRLLVARDDHGALAGVRDCHVLVDAGEAVVVVYLAHALVLPTYRRTGLGALFRRVPLDIARDLLGAAAAEVDLLLAAEMEPPSSSPGDEASVIRLVAYANDGFAAIAPSALPYFQPDFRDLGPRDEPRPVPLLAVVRRVGHEGETTLPARLARAFVTHLYAVFATHVRADHLAALEAATLRVLDTFAGGEVPLVALPRAAGAPIPVELLQ